MEDILLIHRKSNRNFQQLPKHGFHWKTCIRQFVFLNDPIELQESWSGELNFNEDDVLLSGPTALKELIEVLCGLQSPIIGETEVFGQFKLFIDQHKLNTKWVNFVLTEVKKIRSQYITGLGAHSYGSLLRKYLKSTRGVSIIGSGHLAKEIIPWLTCKNELHVACRSPEKLNELCRKYPQLRVDNIQSVNNWQEALIIAAPIEDKEVIEIVSKNKITEVYDLRGEQNKLKSELEKLNRETKMISLNDMFNELESCRIAYAEKMQQIQKFILQTSNEYFQRSELRPLGWDDLCT